MEWNGSIVTAEVFSIVTAEGVCVARVWRKFETLWNGAKFWKPETRVEWGGEDFGQTELRAH